MHKDYQENAVFAWKIGAFDVCMLQPIDLVIGKLDRWHEHDQRDVRLLAEAGLIDATELENRTHEALAGAIGNLERARGSLSQAIILVHNANDLKSCCCYFLNQQIDAIEKIGFFTPSDSFVA